MTDDLTNAFTQRRMEMARSMDTGRHIDYTIGLEDKLAYAVRENAELRDALDYIAFASNGCPVVVDGKDVPEQWQAEIRRSLRHLGECAEQALHASEYTEIAQDGQKEEE